MRLALLALLLPVAAQAQTVLSPGSPDLTAAAPQSFEYDIRIAGDTPRTVGHLTQTETREGDHLVITTHVVYPSRQQEMRDTTVVAWPGLQPVSYGFSDGEETYHVTYAGGRVAGRSVLGNLDEALDAAMPATAFSEGMDLRIPRSVPLRAGYTAMFQTADKRGDLRAGTVTVGEQRGDTWDVTVEVAGQATTYTVDAATRQVLGSSSPRANRTIELGPPAAPPAGPMLRPGDPALDTSWMTDDDAGFVIRVVEPIQMDAGTSRTVRTVAGGIVTSVTTVDVASQDIHITTTATADAATLRPLTSSVSGGPGGGYALTFSETAITGTKTDAAGAATPVSVPLDAPVFDADWTLAIAQSLPLAEGYTANVAAYNGQTGLQTLAFTVGAPQQMDSAAVWPVAVATPAGPVTYFIDAATRHSVMMRMSPQEGVVVEMTRQP